MDEQEQEQYKTLMEDVYEVGKELKIDDPIKVLLLMIYDKLLDIE